MVRLTLGDGACVSSGSWRAANATPFGSFPRRMGRDTTSPSLLCPGVFRRGAPSNRHAGTRWRQSPSTSARSGRMVSTFRSRPPAHLRSRSRSPLEPAAAPAAPGTTRAHHDSGACRQGHRPRTSQGDSPTGATHARRHRVATAAGRRVVETTPRAVEQTTLTARPMSRPRVGRFVARERRLQVPARHG